MIEMFEEVIWTILSVTKLVNRLKTVNGCVHGRYVRWYELNMTLRMKNDSATSPEGTKVSHSVAHQPSRLKEDISTT